MRNWLFLLEKRSLDQLASLIYQADQSIANCTGSLHIVHLRSVVFIIRQPALAS
jgi:hypothetical protein